MAAAAGLGVALAAGGCGWILGLDEFVDAPPPGSGGGGGCATPADCLGGEHATATCADGVCGLDCEEGFADCTDAPGCETATRDDRQNCGGCGVTCGAFCAAGECNDPVDIAAGPLGSSVCALLKDGSVWCWGLLPGPTVAGEVTPTPTRIDLPMAAIQIATGSGLTGSAQFYAGHLCALLEDHTVQCWGSNQYGQLGIGSTEPSATPVDSGLSGIATIALGITNTCAIDDRGRLFCWGQNATGAVGNNTTADVLAPTHIMDSTAQVAVGQLHACAVMLDSSLRCWGGNVFGVLGLGDGAPQQVLEPTQVGTWSAYQEVACSGSHTCARRTNGVACWGYNAGGQLGLGDTVDRNTPQLVNISVVDVLATGGFHTGAMIEGDIYMWGENAYRQLGTDEPFDVTAPTQISLSSVAKVALGSNFSCALTQEGTVLCWGRNTNGQLGDGTTADRPTPVSVVWP